MGSSLNELSDMPVSNDRKISFYTRLPSYIEFDRDVKSYRVKNCYVILIVNSILSCRARHVLIADDPVLRANLQVRTGPPRYREYLVGHLHQCHVRALLQRKDKSLKSCKKWIGPIYHYSVSKIHSIRTC